MVRVWYGNKPDLKAPTDPNAPQFTADSLSFFGLLRNLNPIPALPTFNQYDLGLTDHTTSFEAFRVYVPWVPWDKRGSGIPANYQIQGVIPDAENAFFPLNLDEYYRSPGAGSGSASMVGPYTVDAGGFVPAGQALPFTVNFQNDPAGTTYANEIRIVTELDPNLDAHSFRLGDIKVGDITVHIPQGRSLFQGDFDFTRARGFIFRVSAGVDLQSGVATWLLQAIDPLTGEVLHDPTRGLLRPNKAQGPCA